MDLLNIWDAAQVSGAVGSVLASQSSNLGLAQKLLAHKTETIESSAEHELFRTGNHQAGKIAVYNKIIGQIDYLICYTASTNEVIGEIAAQLQLWRRVGGEHVQGLTTRMFFDYLLREYPAIISHPDQTPDSRGRFWISRMAEATARGFRVALFYSDARRVVWFDPSADTFQGWITAHSPWAISPTMADSASTASEQYLIAK